MLVYAFLPASARADFVRSYGHLDARTRSAARLRGAFHAISVTWYGLELGDPDLLREGLCGMTFVLQP